MDAAQALGGRSRIPRRGRLARGPATGDIPRCFQRALSGDGHARRALAHDIYEPLQASGGGLLETLVTFLDQGLSGGSGRTGIVRSRQHRPLPAAAHPRGHRLQPADLRDAYALRLAILSAASSPAPAQRTDAFEPSSSCKRRRLSPRI